MGKLGRRGADRARGESRGRREIGVRDEVEKDVVSFTTHLNITHLYNRAIYSYRSVSL